ncbi:hypothetical protein MKW92_025331 [Papaver armeniacum]|nr:hypothetical protein MKW92_025331 [Papaver armeniacum]
MITSFTTNVENLQSKVDDLKNMREDIQSRVDAAEKNLELISQVVKAWLDKVDSAITKDIETMVSLQDGETIEMINSKGWRGWRFSRSRYNVSKEAQKKIIIILDLLIEGNNFTDVSIPSQLSNVLENNIIDHVSSPLPHLPPRPRSLPDPTRPTALQPRHHLREGIKTTKGDSFMPFPPLTSKSARRAFGSSEEFKSRTRIMESVMDALKDVGTYVVGVYGIGGAGKTMLMKQVCQRVKTHKMFDVVIVITVSKMTDLSASDVDLKRIQGEIAISLGFNRLEELEEVPKRAAILCQRLKKEGRVLVILDDIWTTEILDLSDVGIPCGENYHKGCKVVFTTRSLEVCNLLNSQRNIEVGMLSREDSWHLFKENIGDLAVALAPETVAKLVKECGGLPLVLVTVGRALRNKDVHVLNDAAFKLETSSYFSAKRDGKIKSKVYYSIKLSYDQLEDETLKTYFLFCSCFPEDYRISTNELMMHVMGDGEILEDIETLKQARSRLHSVLDKLMASCLLLGEKQNAGEISYVYMHDIIRDVALLIASEEGKGFFIKSGAGLKCWPNMSLLQRSISGKCLRMSLIRNDISRLPNETPQFPHLMSLSLKENTSLKTIPENFFQEMEALATLDLSKTGIQSLPSSLSCLVNLYTLCLDNCIFDCSEDISVIGELKELRLLSLENCNLFSLPEEIGGLTNLKLLNLSKNNSLAVVPPNVMSNLICLEELYMRSSFDGWEVEGLGENENNANLEEVASLPCLTTLHLNVFKKFTTEDPAFKELLKFEVSFGRESEHNDPISFDPKRNQFSCHLTVSSAVSSSIKVLLQKVDSLKLIKCFGFSSVENLAASSNTACRLDSLKSLFVKECSDMEYLMGSSMKANGTVPVEIAFPNLKYLFLHSMHSLTEIVHGQISVGCLNNLKLLQVKYCKEILNIFDRHLVKSVINLEELHLESCYNLKEVINGNVKIVEFHDQFQSIGEFHGKFLKSAGLPNLRKLSLRCLPNLETIWRGSIPLESLANLKVVTIIRCDKTRHMFSPELAGSLQKLEELLISDCGQMVKLFDFKVPTATASPIFPSLKRLFIKECNSLQYLFSSTNVLDGGGLSRLEELDIWDCKNLENIMRAEDYDQVVHVIRFPELTTLRLTSLPKLFDFHQGLSKLDFPSLQNVTIVRCLELKKLPLTRSNASQLRKIVGDSVKWFEEFSWEQLKRVRAEERQEEENYWEQEALRPYFEVRLLCFLFVSFCSINLLGFW